MTFVSDHRRIDERSLAMHRVIADKIRRDPALLEIAHDNLRRWEGVVPNAAPYLRRWKQLLELPLEELLSRMVEESEDMTAMRQAGPFAGVLTPKERWAIYDAFAPAVYYASKQSRGPAEPVLP